MAMTAKITWINGRAFLGESGSGHAVVMDGAPESGGFLALAAARPLTW